MLKYRDYEQHANSNKILCLAVLDKLFGLECVLSDGQNEGWRYQEEFEKLGGLNVLEEI